MRGPFFALDPLMRSPTGALAPVPNPDARPPLDYRA
jgi:hypothetical protein